jgi:hypothetical protein
VSGTLLVMADLLNVLMGTSDDTYTGTMPEQISSVLFLVGMVLLVLALIGLYLHQAEAGGRFGLVAFLIALVGTTLMVSSDWSELFIAPILMQAAPTLVEAPPASLMVGFLLNFGFYTVGWLLFGIASFRARVFPRAAAAMLAVGVLLPLITSIPWIFVVWNAAIVWMGLAVLRQKSHVSSVASATAA